ncbi:MAG: hypothetical protein R3Y63_15340 [Eubacteriales bacterium]
MTFEKVLEVFHDYLKEDTICEVILTQRGYTVMFWDERQRDWFGMTHCNEPQDMVDVFLMGYSDMIEQGYTKNRREMTEEEGKIIEGKCDVLRKRVMEE